MTKDKPEQTKHTPTPWTLRTRQIRTWNGYEFKRCNVSITVHELSVKRDPIAGIPASYVCADITSVGDANLDFIVRAVNSHEALLKALKAVRANYVLDLPENWNHDEDGIINPDISRTEAIKAMEDLIDKAIAQAEGGK